MRCLKLVLVAISVLGLPACSAAPRPRPLLPRAEYSLVIADLPGLNAAEVDHTAEMARARIRNELGVALHVTGRLPFDTEPSSFAEVRRQVLGAKSGDADLVLVCLPENSSSPIISGLLQGYAEGVGLVGRRTANVAVVRLSGNQSFDAKVMMHELGHLLGASHRFSGLMAFDSTMLRLSDGDFGETSKGQIWDSLGRGGSFKSATDKRSFTSFDGSALRK